MKTILKYLSAGRYFERPLKKIPGRLYFQLAKAVAAVLILFTAQNAFGQRDLSNVQSPSTLYMNLGVDNFFISRQTFDKWTRMNFNLVENNNKEWSENSSYSIGVDDLDALYNEFRGISANVGPLEMKGWGRREFHMIVPSGVCLQFYQRDGS